MVAIAVPKKEPNAAIIADPNQYAKVHITIRIIINSKKNIIHRH